MKKLLLFVLVFALGLPSFAEEGAEEFMEESEEEVYDSPTKSKSRSKKSWKKSSSKKWKKKKKQSTKYFVEDTSRVDAGVFHVGVMAGGNFYIEPKFDSITLAPIGENFTDFGFQAMAFFDYDYEDTDLGFRGYFGYKYILSSVHVFAAEGIARMLFRMSKKVKFALGTGVSTALWIREVTSTSRNEETIFLPSWIVHLGFDFNPVMTDLKFLANRIGTDSTIIGFELSAGVRL